MDKETKQLNRFLIAIAVIGITVPFMVHNTEQQIQAVQIELGDMEVTEKIYDALGSVILSCGIENEMRTALDGDGIVTWNEATWLGEICEANTLDNATQPFERGMLKQELQYMKNGGVSM